MEQTKYTGNVAQGYDTQTELTGELLVTDNSTSIELDPSLPEHKLIQEFIKYHFNTKESLVEEISGRFSITNIVHDDFQSLFELDAATPTILISHIQELCPDHIKWCIVRYSNSDKWYCFIQYKYLSGPQ